MKAKRCAHPFSEYVGYRQELPNGRIYVYMWNRETNRRRLISRARYRLCVKLGRELGPDEEADHVDDDPTNDDLDNLQVLSGAKNRGKAIIAYGRSRPRHLLPKIRKLVSKGLTHRAIADRIGISRFTVGRILKET